MAGHAIRLRGWGYVHGLDPDVTFRGVALREGGGAEQEEEKGS
jgi:hypothetical protein